MNGLRCLSCGESYCLRLHVALLQGQQISRACARASGLVHRISGGSVSFRPRLEELTNLSANDMKPEIAIVSLSLTKSVIRDNIDDLDLHVQTACKNHIYWNAKTIRKLGENGGHLDVDMNAADDDVTTEPVENVYFNTPAKGHYRVWVENNHKRVHDPAETPYMVRLTIDGETQEKTFQDIDEFEEVVAFEFDIA